VVCLEASGNYVACQSIYISTYEEKTIPSGIEKLAPSCKNRLVFENKMFE